MSHINRSIHQKGASLYFAIIIMSVLLAIVLGIAAILVSQTRMIREMGDSVAAFFAADTGLERILYEDKMCRLPNCSGLGWPCVDNINCDDGRSASDSPVLGTLGQAAYQVSLNNGASSITSVGTYNGIKRAMQVNR
jgi:Tfp pilus assembly protein PilX